METPLCYSVYLKNLRDLVEHTHHGHLLSITQRWDEVRARSGQSRAPLLLAITLYGESRGEPLPGIRAIVDVIVNRCVRDAEPNIDKILLKPFQFSCLNYGDRSLEGADNLTDDQVTLWLKIAQDSLDAARDRHSDSALAKATLFCTENALQHQLRRWIRDEKPFWNFEKIRRVAFIGRHIFFEEV